MFESDLSEANPNENRKKYIYYLLMKLTKPTNEDMNIFFGNAITICYESPKKKNGSGWRYGRFSSLTKILLSDNSLT